MQWLSPQWLWLLGALAIPLLVHLLRRSSPREITFAAAHWLQQRPRRSLRRLQLRDKWLLLLRLLLVSLLAALLAAPLLQRPAVAAGENTLLVDPRIERAALQDFLQRREPFEQIAWLQAEPTPIARPRPPAPDLWRALSALADRAEFRRAHLLLLNGDNPSGHGSLRLSPDWQWHALNRRAQSAAALPAIALLGDGPAWLEPALQSLAKTTLPHLSLQRLATADTLDPRAIDWLIYDTAGPLPAALRDFVNGGGLLISDRRVASTGDLSFAAIDGDTPREAAAIGRGSWLRYTGDWHSDRFFHRAALPRQLWRDWSAQDWALQNRSRARWSIDAPPGIPVAAAAVAPSRRAPLRDALLLAFTLLLALERALALTRATARESGEQRA